MNGVNSKTIIIWSLKGGVYVMCKMSTSEGQL